MRFQEIAEGNLLYLLDETSELLNRKFFIKPVNFEGLQRIEKGEYQTLCDVSRATATRDLKELTEKKILDSSGSKGGGSVYQLAIAS